MNRPISAFDEMPSFTVKYMSIPEQSLCSLFSCTHREESPIPMYVSDRGDKLTVSAAEAIYYEANDYDKYSYFLPIDDEINDMSTILSMKPSWIFAVRKTLLHRSTAVLSSVGISTANSRIIAMESIFAQRCAKTDRKKPVFGNRSRKHARRNILAHGAKEMSVM